MPGPLQKNRQGLPIAGDDEQHAMPGRIARVPFDLAVGNNDALAGIPVRAMQRRVLALVGDDGDVRPPPRSRR